MPCIAPPGADAGPGLLGGVVQEPPHLPRAKAYSTAAGRRGAKGSHQGMGVLQPRADGVECPHADVVAQHHGPKEMRPTDAEFLPERQRYWHDGAARMRSSPGAVVVALIGMSQLPVCHCCLNRTAQDVR